MKPGRPLQPDDWPALQELFAQSNEPYFTDPNDRAVCLPHVAQGEDGKLLAYAAGRVTIETCINVDHRLPPARRLRAIGVAFRPFAQAAFDKGITVIHAPVCMKYPEFTEIMVERGGWKRDHRAHMVLDVKAYLEGRQL